MSIGIGTKIYFKGSRETGTITAISKRWKATLEVKAFDGSEKKPKKIDVSDISRRIQLGYYEIHA